MDWSGLGWRGRTPVPELARVLRAAELLSAAARREERDADQQGTDRAAPPARVGVPDRAASLDRYLPIGPRLRHPPNHVLWVLSHPQIKRTRTTITIPRMPATLKKSPILPATTSTIRTPRWSPSPWPTQSHQPTGGFGPTPAPLFRTWQMPVYTRRPRGGD